MTIDGGIGLSPLTCRKCACIIYLQLIGKVQLRCAGININANECANVSISALYGARAAGYARNPYQDVHTSQDVGLVFKSRQILRNKKTD